MQDENEKNRLHDIEVMKNLSAMNKGDQGNQGADNGDAARVAAEEASRQSQEAERIAAEVAAKQNEGNDVKTDWFEHPEVKERFGDRYKSKQEFFENIEKTKEVEKIVEKPIEYSTEFIAKADAYVKGGGKIEEFLSTQLTKWDDLPADQVIKADLKQKNPELNDAQIDRLVRKSYDLKTNVAAEDLTEDEKEAIEDAKLQMQIDSKKIREANKALQIKMSEPPNTQKELEQKAAHEAAEKESAAKREKDFKDWQTTVNTTLEKNKDLIFKIPTGKDGKDAVEVKYAISEDDVKAAREIFDNPSKLLSLYANKDGSADVERFVKDVLLITQQQKAMPIMFEDYYAKRMEEVEKKAKNITSIKERNQGLGGSAEEAWVEKMRKTQEKSNASSRK